MVEKMGDRVPTRAELTRERILEAGEEVAFARHGLNGTRIREDRRNGTSEQRDHYSYFPGKTDLYEAVLERGMRPLINLMVEFSASPQDMEAAGKLLRGTIEHLRERPRLSRLVYLDITSEGSCLSDLSSRWLRPLLDPGLSQLKRATAATPWEGNLTPLIVTSFLQLSFGHLALSPLFCEIIGEDPASEQWGTHQTTFMLTLLEQMF